MGQIHNITPEKAKSILESERAVLIDVREPAEHRSEKIPVSKNIPLSKIHRDILTTEINSDQKILVHCKSGRRSAEACKKLSNTINADIYDVQGGIENWSKSGFETLKSDINILPLDRQVQLVVSLLVLSGLVVYYFVTPFGLLLPLVAGLGLMNAALTGWCGMAKLLAVMPWNQ